MKKILITALVFGIAPVAKAVQLKVDEAPHSSVDIKASVRVNLNEDGEFLDNSSRWGLRGCHQVRKHYVVEGQYEQAFDAVNDSSNESVRLGLVRANWKNNSVIIGQQWTVDYDLVGVYADLFETFGGDNQYFERTGARIEALEYRNFSDGCVRHDPRFRFGVNYRADNEDQQAYTVAVNYKLTNSVSIGASIQAGNDDTAGNDDFDYSQLYIGGSFETGPVTMNFLLGDYENVEATDTEHNSLDLNIFYRLTRNNTYPEIKIYGGHSTIEISKFEPDDTREGDTSSYALLGALYRDKVSSYEIVFHAEIKVPDQKDLGEQQAAVDRLALNTDDEEIQIGAKFGF